MDSQSTEIAIELFKKINRKKQFFKVSPTAAELAKLYANTYRYVNFALANSSPCLPSSSARTPADN